MTDTGHIVKSFDADLQKVTNAIVEMGGMAEAQLTDAIEALSKRDSDLAARTIDNDQRIDALEREVEEMSIRFLALRQPMADDLRSVIAALKIASILERIADYAANVAKRSIALNQVPQVKPVGSIPRMAELVQRMIADILDAYLRRDADLAREVWERDEAVDEIYNSLFRELLTYMMEDARSITTCTHLLFMAKNIERMGDHVTNIAEIVQYMIKGVPFEEKRPKGDKTSYAVIDDKGGEDK